MAIGSRLGSESRTKGFILLIGAFRRKTGYIDEKEKVYDSLRGRSVECSRL